MNILQLSVEMPATNSINIQLSAPSKPPADRSFDRQPHNNHSFDGGNRRNGGMAGRNGNGQSYEDDLDYVLEKVIYFVVFVLTVETLNMYSDLD